MFRLIYRQRRRILFSAGFITLALAMMAVRDIGPHRDEIFAGADWIVAASIATAMLLVALGTALVVTAFVVLLHRFRFIAEQVALMLFLNAALHYAIPWAYDDPILGALIPVALILLIVSVMAGPVLDRFRIWVDHNECRSFTAPEPPEALWPRLIPDAEHAATHWDPLLYEVTPAEDEPDAYEVQYALGYSTYEHQTITFLAREYPHHFRYHHVGEVNPKNRSLVEGIYDVRIEPEGDGARVTVTQQRTALLPRIGILMWLDDELGSRLDCFRARQAGRRDWSTAGQMRRDALALG